MRITLNQAPCGLQSSPVQVVGALGLSSRSVRGQFASGNSIFMETGQFLSTGDDVRNVVADCRDKTILVRDVAEVATVVRTVAICALLGW